jgi:hypothetical protein
MNALRHGFKTAAVAVIACIVLSAAPLMAGTQTLLDASSAGGWSASAPDDVNVGLQVLGLVNGTLFLKKHAVFSGEESNGIIPINFLKGQSGVNKIVIDFEEIGNETGKAFDSFSMTLLGDATYADSSSGFNGDVFKKTDLSVNKQVVTLSDGSLGDGESFFPGFGKNGGDLTINATGSFSLNEGAGSPPAVIPLPAAAWMSLSGLLGLGALKGARKLRSLVA